MPPITEAEIRVKLVADTTGLAPIKQALDDIKQSAKEAQQAQPQVPIPQAVPTTQPPVQTRPPTPPPVIPPQQQTPVVTPRPQPTPTPQPVPLPRLPTPTPTPAPQLRLPAPQPVRPVIPTPQPQPQPQPVRPTPTPTPATQQIRIPLPVNIVQSVPIAVNTPQAAPQRVSTPTPQPAPPTPQAVVPTPTPPLTPTPQSIPPVTRPVLQPAPQIARPTPSPQPVPQRAVQQPTQPRPTTPTPQPTPQQTPVATRPVTPQALPPQRIAVDVPHIPPLQVEDVPPLDVENVPPIQVVVPTPQRVPTPTPAPAPAPVTPPVAARPQPQPQPQSTPAPQQPPRTVTPQPTPQQPTPQRVITPTPAPVPASRPTPQPQPQPQVITPPRAISTPPPVTQALPTPPRTVPSTTQPVITRPAPPATQLALPPPTQRALPPPPVTPQLALPQPRITVSVPDIHPVKVEIPPPLKVEDVPPIKVEKPTEAPEVVPSPARLVIPPPPPSVFAADRSTPEEKEARRTETANLALRAQIEARQAAGTAVTARTFQELVRGLEAVGKATLKPEDFGIGVPKRREETAPIAAPRITAPPSAPTPATPTSRVIPPATTPPTRGPVPPTTPLATTPPTRGPAPIPVNVVQSIPLTINAPRTTTPGAPGPTTPRTTTPSSATTPRTTPSSPASEAPAVNNEKLKESGGLLRGLASLFEINTKEAIRLGFAFFGVGLGLSVLDGLVEKARETLAEFVQLQVEEQQTLKNLNAAYGQTSEHVQAFIEATSKGAEAFTGPQIAQAVQTLRPLGDRLRLSAQEMEKLVVASTKLADIHSIPLTDSTSALADALTGSSSAADQLGLHLDDVTVASQYLNGQFDTTFSSLNAQQQAAARLSVALEQIGQQAQNTAGQQDSFARKTREAERAQLDIAKELSGPAYGIAKIALDNYVSALEALRDRIKEVQELKVNAPAPSGAPKPEQTPRLVDVAAGAARAYVTDTLKIWGAGFDTLGKIVEDDIGRVTDFASATKIAAQGAIHDTSQLGALFTELGNDVNVDLFKEWGENLTKAAKAAEDAIPKVIQDFNELGDTASHNLDLPDLDKELKDLRDIHVAASPLPRIFAELAQHSGEVAQHISNIKDAVSDLSALRPEQLGALAQRQAEQAVLRRRQLQQETRERGELETNLQKALAETGNTEIKRQIQEQIDALHDVEAATMSVTNAEAERQALARRGVELAGQEARAQLNALSQNRRVQDIQLRQERDRLVAQNRLTSPEERAAARRDLRRQQIQLPGAQVAAFDANAPVRAIQREEERNALLERIASATESTTRFALDITISGQGSGNVTVTAGNTDTHIGTVVDNRIQDHLQTQAANERAVNQRAIDNASLYAGHYLTGATIIAGT